MQLVNLCVFENLMTCLHSLGSGNGQIMFHIRGDGVCHVLKTTALLLWNFLGYLIFDFFWSFSLHTCGTNSRALKSDLL